MHKKLTYDIPQAFVSMFIAWFTGYIYFAIHSVYFSGWGYITDFSAIFFWTGLFTFICVFTFVPLIIFLFRKTSLSRSNIFFPLFTILFSQIALTILLLPFTDFQPFQMGFFYFVYAAVIGLAFGLFYLLFQSKLNLKDKKQWIKKTIFLFFSVLFLVFLFYVFPYVSPGLAYKYFGDSIQDKAIISVLRKCKVGDTIQKINCQLPNFASNTRGKGMMSASMDNFYYNIEFENGKITKLITKDTK